MWWDQGVTWKESLAGERGAMGLSVLQKWIVEGRALGVNKTGVCSHTNIKKTIKKKKRKKTRKSL